MEAESDTPCLGSDSWRRARGVERAAASDAEALEVSISDCGLSRVQREPRAPCCPHRGASKTFGAKGPPKRCAACPRTPDYGRTASTVLDGCPRRGSQTNPEPGSRLD